MSRMENLDIKLRERQAAIGRAKTAQGGMTDDDLFMRAGKLAQMFCITFAFAMPSIGLWAYVL